MTDPASTVAAFAAALFEPDDIVEVRLLPSREQKWVKAKELSSPDMVAWLVERNGHRQNIYIGANPRKAMGGASADDVALARSVFADFDGGTTPEQALARVRAARLPEPSLIIASGGGTHCYWLLAEAVHNLAVFTSIQKGLIAAVDSDKAINDAPRIMRLPGFINHKYTPTPTCRIVESRPDRRYALGAFPTVTNQAPAALAPSAGAVAVGRSGLSQKTRQFLDSGASTGERNAACFAAACDYAGCGVPQVEAERELLDACRRHGMTGQDDFDESEVEQAIASAYSKARSRSWSSGANQFMEIQLKQTEGAESAAAEYVRLEVSGGTTKGKQKLFFKYGGDTIYADEINPTSTKARKKLIKDVQQALPAIDEQDLDRKLVQLAATPVKATTEPKAEASTSRDELLNARDELIAQRLRDTPSHVVAEAEELLRDPRLIDLVLRDIGEVGVVGEQEFALTVYLIGTSRLLPKPLAAITQGMSSTGKSYVPERIGTLIPEESLLVATDITTNALYYMEPGSLMHRFVAAGERSRNDDDDRAEATRALREMISAGELHKVVPVKGADNRMVSQVVWQPGPIAFIESTTKAKIFDEDANRCLLLGTDESATQTEKIVKAQAARAAGAETDCTAIVARHQAMQRLLRRCRVLVPFAPAIANVLPIKRQEARRAMPHILSMISAVAILYQRQRSTEPLEHGSKITATLEDYVIARRLLADPMGRSLGGALPAAVTNFGKRVVEHHGAGEFSANDLAKSDGVLTSRGKINEYLRALAEAGVVECTQDGKGNRAAMWHVVGEVPVAGALWLPTLDQLKAGGA